MLRVSNGRSIKDPFTTSLNPPPRPGQSICVLAETSSYEAGVIRLLLGTADIIDNNGNPVVAQRENYFVLGLKTHRGRSIRGVRDALKNMGFDWRRVDSHLRSTLKQQGYFEQVLLELVEYFVKTERKEHTLAFIHAYRLLERISFVFPFLFSVTSTNYVGAFATLKSYFNGSGESELALLKKFQKEALDHNQCAAATTIDVSTLPNEHAVSAFKLLKRLVSQDDVISETPNVNLEIKSGSLLELLIVIRNRYFHYSISNPSNISSAEIPDTDLFFQTVNKPIMNWLGIIFAAVLAHKTK